MNASRCAEPVIEAARLESRRVLLLHEAYRLLECYGLPVPRYRLARSPREAVEAAEEIGYPVALKIVSPDVIHKSEVGGVVLDLKTPREVEEAFNAIIERVARRGARVVGVLVQEMVPAGLEVLVGGLRDAVFGPLVAYGLGGVFVEVYDDVAFRVAPLTRIDAETMVWETRSSRLLRGYRRMPPRDVEALIDAILRVSKLVYEQPVAELDINPLMLYEEGRGAKIADARVILAV